MSPLGIQFTNFFHSWDTYGTNPTELMETLNKFQWVDEEKWTKPRATKKLTQNVGE